MIILFLGISGSGKDTQAELLAKEKGFLVVSTGDLIREQIESDSEIGREIHEVVSRGDWVQDEIVYKLLGEKIDLLKGKNIILTGAVRDVNQIPMLDSALQRFGDDLDYVMLFELSEEEAMARLSGRRYDKSGKMYHIEYNPPPHGVEVEVREDDTPESIRHRLKEFRDTIEPITKTYKDRGILIEIDASGTIPQIHQQVIQQLEILNV